MAIENVISAQTFKPERVIYLVPGPVGEYGHIRASLQDFFISKGLDLELKFVQCSQYKADRIYSQLVVLGEKYDDLAIEVTGGNDAALFAAGMFCKDHNIPAFTYSRHSSRFYDIMNASFADGRLCDLTYSVEDFFKMAGGTMRKGRVDNRILSRYDQYINGFFDIFMKYKHTWPDAVTFFQRISRGQNEDGMSLQVTGDLEQKGERGRRVHGDRKMLQSLEKLGFIENLSFQEDNMVSFKFKDEQVRTWLRDVGEALELYIYRACRNAGIFDDVVSSAIVDWDGTVGHDSVSNEIDVVATRGIKPVFISCKACEIKTEALNELAILKQRFGGKGAKAIIVSTEKCNAAARHRAAQLGIAVIDVEEIISGGVVDRIKVIMKC